MNLRSKQKLKNSYQNQKICEELSSIKKGKIKIKYLFSYAESKSKTAPIIGPLCAEEDLYTDNGCSAQ